MGAPLNTPPEAMDAFSAKIRAVTEPADRLDALAGMEAAARLIVAAELDRISPELTSAVCSKTDEWDAGWWAALEWVGQQLGRRASELRGEG